MAALLPVSAVRSLPRGRAEPSDPRPNPRYRAHGRSVLPGARCCSLSWSAEARASHFWSGTARQPLARPGWPMRPGRSGSSLNHAARLLEKVGHVGDDRDRDRDRMRAKAGDDSRACSSPTWRPCAGQRVPACSSALAFLGAAAMREARERRQAKALRRGSRVRAYWWRRRDDRGPDMVARRSAGSYRRSRPPAPRWRSTRRCLKRLIVRGDLHSARGVRGRSGALRDTVVLYLGAWASSWASSSSMRPRR
jgi:hypothetical protein